ncbi:MAG TPA: hypothetical protein VF053_01780 [Streptosporangiales bacterium]
MNAAAPYGRGSRIAAQLQVDRHAQAAGHSVDWRAFHDEHAASAGQLLTGTADPGRPAVSRQAFSVAIYMRQFRTPQSQQAQPRRASRTSGTRRLLGLGRRTGERSSRQDPRERGSRSGSWTR